MKLGFQNSFDIQGNENFGADNTAGILHRTVPAYAKIQAVQCRFAGEADPRHPSFVVRRFPPAQVMEWERNGTSDATDGQIAGQLEVVTADPLRFRGNESNGGMVGNV